MNINEIRTQIDNTDKELLDLFLKRMDLAAEIAVYKNNNSLHIVDKAREREILSKAMELSGEDELYAYQFFSKLIDLSKAKQSEYIRRPSKTKQIIGKSLLDSYSVFPNTGSVACQGIEGANSQQACDKILPRGSIMYVKTFEAVFNAVDSGLCKYGVVPVENNTSGSIRAVYDLLRDRQFSIVKSINLPVHHALLVNSGAAASDIQEIYSHEQAIDQCGKFLSSLSPEVKIIPCSNTAVAAKSVAASKDIHKASISSIACAELYGLDILSDNIQDNDNNYTKFICIAKEPAIYAGANKISLILSCHDKPGALYDLLSIITAHGINMSKLESCPVKGGNFDFIFYIELDASVREKGIISMLEELERNSASFFFLGNYSSI